MKFYKLPETLPGEIKTFEGQIKDYRDAKINPVQFKGIRVAHGIYEQRKPETHMVRIRCGGCGITPVQLKKVAELAGQYSSGEVHVTTRGEMQLHYVDLKDVITVYQELTTVGLSSRGGGGNTIRNILASHDSGIAPDEVFDVQPYASALTTRMIAEADSWNLPRKFKIAFSNSDKDSSRATLTCLGFIAKIKDGKKGFKVYCAGGMGSYPLLGNVLYEFAPEEQVYYIAKAMKLMFDKYGNRRQRSKAKLKFLWEKLGEAEFREKFNFELDILSKDKGLALQLEELPNVANVKSGYKSETISSDEQKVFETWKKRHVRNQKQEGLMTITVPLRLGDIEGKDAIKIAEVLENFGENVMRYDVKQNLHIRNIPTAYLPNIFHLVKGLHSLSLDPAIFGNMIACTGADTCKLGICLPRGVTPQIQSYLRDSNIDLDLINDVKIHISGCPNTCGCHHVADLGFYGKVLRSESEMLPGYNILAGAIVEDGKTRFSKKVDEVSAKDLPAFVRGFLTIYSQKKARFASFAEYIDKEGEADIHKVADNYRKLPTLQENKEYFYDWGSKEIFSLLKGQRAECSAGMFDMIDVDEKTIREAIMHYQAAETDDIREKALSAMLFSSARMLLVTRGIESRDKEAVFENFIQHFIKSGLVPEKFTEVARYGMKSSQKPIFEYKDDIFELAEHMKKLYGSMDDSLRFTGIALTEEQKKDSAVSQTQKASEEAAKQERFKDLRGVGCPMNFVKTKIELSSMQSGDKLKIYLDEGEPIENVPGSVIQEGHKVLKQEKQENYWSVLIEKA